MCIRHKNDFAQLLVKNDFYSSLMKLFALKDIEQTIFYVSVSPRSLRNVPFVHVTKCALICAPAHPNVLKSKGRAPLNFFF